RADRLAGGGAGRGGVAGAAHVPTFAGATVAARVAEARIEDPHGPRAARDLHRVVVEAIGGGARGGGAGRVRRLERAATTTLGARLVAGEERVALDAGRALALHRAPELLRPTDRRLAGRRWDLGVLDEGRGRGDHRPARPDLELVEPDLC